MQEIKIRDTLTIRVTKSEYPEGSGKMRLDIREFNPTVDKKYQYSPKGINIPFTEDFVNQLIAAINLEAFGGFETAKETKTEPKETLDEFTEETEETEEMR